MLLHVFFGDVELSSVDIFKHFLLIDSTADRSKIGGDQDLIKPDILEVHLLLLVTNT